jgi:hypothetical protein
MTEGGIAKHTFVPREQIEKARQVDLLSYLQAFEPYELVRCGRNVYCTRTHDSLKISNGKWFWWSMGFGSSNALDYLVKVKGLELADAVEILTGKTVAIPSFSLPDAKAKRYDHLMMPRHNFDCKKARAYLFSRGISESIIDDCIAKKLIAESNKYGSVLFLGYDYGGEIKHCAWRATDGTDGKKDVAGSDKTYTFRLVAEGKSDSVFVFECAIDLLSYATILNENGGDYKHENMLSLSGVYAPNGSYENTKIPVPLTEFLSHEPSRKTVLLCFDNDDKGRRAAASIRYALGGRYEVKYTPPPDGSKDYNDYLMKKCNSNERKEKQYEDNRKNDAR